MEDKDEELEATLELDDARLEDDGSEDDEVERK